MALVVRHVFFGINRIDRTLGNADRAVDALVGVNREEIGAFAEAIDGAYVHAIGVFALDAGFGNGMGHEISSTVKGQAKIRAKPRFYWQSPARARAGLSGRLGKAGRALDVALVKARKMAQKSRAVGGILVGP